MPPRRKAGRLEIEVAANLDQWEKDQQRVRKEARGLGGEVSREMGKAESSFRKFLKIGLDVTALLGSLAIIFRGPLRNAMLGLIQDLGNLSVRFATFLQNLQKGGPVLKQIGENLNTLVGSRLLRGMATLRAVGRVAGDRIAAGFRTAADAARNLSQRSAVLTASIAGIATAARRVGGLLARVFGPAIAVFRKLTVGAGSFVTTGLGAMGRVLGPLAQRFTQFVSVVLKGFGRVVSSVAEQIIAFTEIGLKLAGRALQNLAARFADANGNLNGFGKALSGVAHGVTVVAGMLERLAKILFGLRAAIAISAGAFVLWANSLADQFAPGLARVLTLIGTDSPHAIRALTAEIGVLAAETGIATQELLGGLYRTLSALPQLVKAPQKAMQVLGVASKVAATGFATLDEAVAALTGIMVAFKVPAEEAIEISDALFAAQDRGVTTFGEMAASMGRVTGILSALNLDWKDLLAIIATTSPFLSTSEVITGVGSAIRGVIQQTPEAIELAEELGIQFNAVAVEAQGLIPFLRGVIEATDGSLEALSKLFGRQEAVTLLAILGNNMEKLAEDIELVGTNTGKTVENLRIMQTTVDAQKDRIKEAIKTGVRPFGQAWEGVRIRIMRAVADTVEGFGKMASSAEELGARMDEDFDQGFIEDFFDSLTRGAEDAGDAFDDLGAKIRRNFMDSLTEFIELLKGLQEGPDVDVTFGRPFFPRPGSLELQNQIDFMAIALADATRREFAIEFEQGKDIPSIELAAIKARNQVEQLGISLKNAATVEFLRSEDPKAYEAAIRNARIEVNRMVMAEIKVLEARGATIEQLQPLLDLMQTYSTESTKAQKEQERAIERVNALLKDSARLTARGIAQFQEVPREAQSAITELLRLDKALADIDSALADAATPERRAELEGLKTTFEGQRDALEGVVARVLELATQMDFAGAAGQRLKGQLREIQLASEAGFDLFDPETPQEAVALIAEIGRIEQSIESMKFSIAALPSLQLRVEGQEAVDRLEERLDKLIDDLGRLSGMKVLVEQFGSALVRAVSGLDDETFTAVITQVSGLSDEFEELTEATLDLRLAKLATDSDALAAALKRVKAASKGLQTDMKGVVAELRRMHAAGELTTEELEKLVTLLEMISPEAAEETGQSFEKMAGTAEAIARGVLAIADGMGILDDQTRKVLEGMINLAAAAGRIASGDIIGGAIQGIGGIIQLVGGIFGESAEDKRGRIALERNTTALLRLSENMAKLIDLTLGTTGEQARGFRALAQPGLAFQGLDPVSIMAGGIEVHATRKRLRDIAKEYGITIEDLLAVAETAGISISEVVKFFDNRPLEEIDLPMLFIQWGELAEVMNGIETERLKEFFDSVEGGLQRLRAEADLFDESSEESLSKLRTFFTDSIKLTGELGDLQKELAGLDLTTEAGRKRAEEIIEKIAKAFFAGAIDITQLDKLTPEEFLQLARDIETGLDDLAEEMGDEADDATTSAGVFRGVTLVQGNILVAQGHTLLFFVQDIATVLRGIASKQGVEVGPPLPVAPFPGFGGDPVDTSGTSPTPTSAPIAVTDTPFVPSTERPGGRVPGLSGGDVTVNAQIGPNEFHGITDPDEVAATLTETGAREIERVVERRIRRRMADGGYVQEPV